MAGRGMPRRHLGMGPVMRHPLGPHPLEQMPPIEPMERRLAGQYEELQRLAMDNQRLGATHRYIC